MVNKCIESDKSEIIVLGECFNSFYRKEELHINSEIFDLSEENNPTMQELLKIAKEKDVVIMGKKGDGMMIA